MTPRDRRRVIVLAVAALVAAIAEPAQAQRRKAARGGGAVVGRWLGQDGNDRVGPSSTPGPSGVQDMHFAVEGLPAARTVTAAKVDGDGGDEWLYQGRYGPWAAEVVKPKGATRADVFVEPSHPETGRKFFIHLTLDDGRTVSAEVRGGPADPARRMAAAKLAVEWIGQDGRDGAGPGPGVGPDGVADLVVKLDRLEPSREIRTLALERPGGDEGWIWGVADDDHNDWPTADLVRDPKNPATADLAIAPIDGLEPGESLVLRLVYADESTDSATVTVGKFQGAKPAKAIPPAKVADAEGARVRWAGQDDAGNVRLVVEGLPTRRRVVAASLSDGVAGSWQGKLDDRAVMAADPYAGRLELRPSARGGSLELAFPPSRAESGRAMTLRLVFADDRPAAVIRFAAGAADLTKRSPAPAGPPVRVAAGTDQLPRALAGSRGQLMLASGTHRLTKPLVLDRPVTIQGAPGAILLFDQPADAPPWTAAIKIHRGNTTLEGFAVRFAGPVRWDAAVSYGPALIGATDDRDGNAGDGPPRVSLAFRKLDLEAPPAPPGTDWQPSPLAMRLVNAEGGLIEDCTIKAGPIEFFRGPWQIRRNKFLGVPSRQTSPAAISGHWVHDLSIEDNTADGGRPPASGKTWRFLVLSNAGHNVHVRKNAIVNLGPRDDDPIPHPNSPEVVLTESYRTHYEGKPAAISADGRLLTIPGPQGDPARVGAVVAVLDGAKAGTWSVVAQAIDDRNLLVDPPLPRDAGVVIVAPGFVGCTFEENTIDARGGSQAVNLVLAGNHYGTAVRKNRLLGGGEPFRLVATATEAPRRWGWSHAPFLGLELSENVIDGSLRPGPILVEHAPAIGKARDRVYMTATLRNNTATPTTGAGVAIVVGDPASIDLGELRLDPGDAKLRVEAARVGGRDRRDSEVPCPEDRR